MVIISGHMTSLFKFSSIINNDHLLWLTPPQTHTPASVRAAMLTAGRVGPMHNELHKQVSNLCEAERNRICHSCSGNEIHHGEGVSCLATKTWGGRQLTSIAHHS